MPSARESTIRRNQSLYIIPRVSFEICAKRLCFFSDFEVGAVGVAGVGGSEPSSS